MPKYKSFAFYREQGYWGREEINLLVHARRSKLFVFLFLSFLLPVFLFLLFYFLFFSMFTSWLCLSLEIPNTMIFESLLSSVHSKGSFIELAVTGIYYFSPQLPLSGVSVLADHLLVVNGSTTTTYLC